MDLDLVGKMAAVAMDIVEDEFGEDESAIVRSVTIILDVETDDDVKMRSYSSESRPYVVEALINEALINVQEQRAQIEEPDE